MIIKHYSILKYRSLFACVGGGDALRAAPTYAQYVTLQIKIR
jgi:hypothetical protein